MERDPPAEPTRETDRPAPEPVVEPQAATKPATEPQAGTKPSAWEVSDRKRRNGMIARLVVGLSLLVLFVIFVSLNSDSVRVHFVFLQTDTPLVWVFLICALVGALVAFLLGRSGRRASRKYIKELERRLEVRGDKRG